MKNTKVRFRLRLAFVSLAFLCIMSAEGKVVVYQAIHAAPEAQISIQSDEKPKLVSSTKETISSLPSPLQRQAVAKVCADHFRDAPNMVDQCRWDLLAIAYTESRFNCGSVGDDSKARGCYQIWYKLHKITVEQAEDFEWAANWTLERMISQGFPVYRSWALGSHNSFTPEVNARYSKIVKEKSAEFERTGL